MAYCEQLGWYLHVPGGVRSPKVQRQACTAQIPTYLTPGPSRERRLSQRQAIRAPAPLRARRCPRVRQVRSRARSARWEAVHARPPSEAASHGCEQPRSRRTAAPRDRPAARHPSLRRAGTSGERDTASKRTDRVGRRCRNPVNGRAGCGAARAGASGREALAPSRATPLEDRAASARGHSRSEPVSPLSATDVRLVGSFHVVFALERVLEPGERAV